MGKEAVKILNPWVVCYSTGPTSGTTLQGHYNTYDAAKVAATSFLVQYPTGYTVWISKPYIRVMLERPPIVTEELDY